MESVNGNCFQVASEEAMVVTVGATMEGMAEDTITGKLDETKILRRSNFFIFPPFLDTIIIMDAVKC